MRESTSYSTIDTWDHKNTGFRGSKGSGGTASEKLNKKVNAKNWKI